MENVNSTEEDSFRFFKVDLTQSIDTFGKFKNSFFRKQKTVDVGRFSHKFIVADTIKIKSFSKLSCE